MATRYIAPPTVTRRIFEREFLNQSQYNAVHARIANMCNIAICIYMP